MGGGQTVLLPNRAQWKRGLLGDGVEVSETRATVSPRLLLQVAGDGLASPWQQLQSREPAVRRAKLNRHWKFGPLSSRSWLTLFFWKSCSLSLSSWSGRVSSRSRSHVNSSTFSGFRSEKKKRCYPRLLTRQHSEQKKKKQRERAKRAKGARATGSKGQRGKGPKGQRVPRAKGSKVKATARATPKATPAAEAKTRKKEGTAPLRVQLEKSSNDFNSFCSSNHAS